MVVVIVSQVCAPRLAARDHMGRRSGEAALGWHDAQAWVLFPRLICPGIECVFQRSVRTRSLRLWRSARGTPLASSQPIGRACRLTATHCCRRGTRRIAIPPAMTRTIFDPLKTDRIATDIARVVKDPDIAAS